MNLLDELHAEEGVTILLVTHEPRIASFAGRQISLRDGLIVADERRQGIHAAPA
jgi:ABC-type lipoprotein export system ATPase subunit